MKRPGSTDWVPPVAPETACRRACCYALPGIVQGPSFAVFNFMWAFFIRVYSYLVAVVRTVRVYCRWVSTALQRARHSTAQHEATQSPPHKAANTLHAEQSATTQASRQSWREPACRASLSCYGMLSCVSLSYIPKQVLRACMRRSDCFPGVWSPCICKSPVYP